MVDDDRIKHMLKELNVSLVDRNQPAEKSDPSPSITGHR